MWQFKSLLHTFCKGSHYFIQLAKNLSGHIIGVNLEFIIAFYIGNKCFDGFFIRFGERIIADINRNSSGAKIKRQS